MPEDSPRFLFSPGWPASYAPNLECTWVVRSPDSTVELNLLSLDVEEYPNCYFDSLVIRNGEGDRGAATNHMAGPSDHMSVWISIDPGKENSLQWQLLLQNQLYCLRFYKQRNVLL